MENKTIFDRKYKKLNNGAETILALLNERYSLYVNIKHNKEMKGDENNEEKKTENSSIRPIHNTQKIKTADRGLSNAEVQDYEKLLK
jgi:hypothetical protein